MLQGCTPVKVTERLAEDPTQIVELPENKAVGNGKTVTTALPVNDVALQWASLTAVNV